MEAAPDWNISRNRYWGSPVPVWECECGERIVPGSIKELEELSGREIKDLHKPEIDEVKIECPKDGKEMRRVPEVLDSWIEAGSASFAERHFPFEGETDVKDFFPPDFIVEYTGQIRAWFYVLHVISTAIYDSKAFKNVLVTGVILGTDGRKMSKNYGNFPDPKQVMQTYGGDALRLYLMGSPVMKGEDVNFSNDGVPEVTRGFMLILWNCYKYFVDYANIFGWSCEVNGRDAEGENKTILDKWVLARLTELVVELNKTYESYDTTTSVKLIREFVVNDFSTWYIRRNRDRVANNENAKDRGACLSIMYGVLVTLSKVMAPLAPFISEEIYKNLGAGESVHLDNFPDGDKSLLDERLIKEMKFVREVVEMGHSARKKEGIKLRQPLNAIIISHGGQARIFEDADNIELNKIIIDELNVKNVYGYHQHKEASELIESGHTVEVAGRDGYRIFLDTNITPALAKEGEAREIIRNVQKLRKEQNLTLNDAIELTLPTWPKEHEEFIKKSTHANSITEGSEITIRVV